jgi:hypothetical protein
MVHVDFYNAALGTLRGQEERAGSDPTDAPLPML